MVAVPGSPQTTRRRRGASIPLYMLAAPAAAQLINRIADQLEFGDFLVWVVALWRTLTHGFWQYLLETLRIVVSLPPISPTQMDVLSLGLILSLADAARLARVRFSFFGQPYVFQDNLSAFRVFLASSSMLIFVGIFVLPTLFDHVRAILMIQMIEARNDETLRLILYGVSRILLLVLLVAFCVLAARSDITRLHGSEYRARPRLVSGKWNWRVLCYASAGIILASTEYVTIEGAVLYAMFSALLWGYGFGQLCRHSPLFIWTAVSMAAAVVAADQIVRLIVPFLPSANLGDA